MSVDRSILKTGKGGPLPRTRFSLNLGNTESTHGANEDIGGLKMTKSDTQRKENDDRLSRSVSDIKYF